jgi:hypothetical protein
MNKIKIKFLKFAFEFYMLQIEANLVKLFFLKRSHFFIPKN